MRPLSQVAHSVDLLTLVLTLVCALVVILIIGFITYYCLKYKAGKKADRSYDTQSTGLEITWTALTLVIFVSFFAWGMNVYQKQVSPKKADYEVYVFAKRWMWEFHHPGGLREINHLHLPSHKNIRLRMVSKDVIHSFYIPDFRVKQDILPETYTSIHFKAERVGDFLLQCAEYCGTDHSRMGGKVTFLKEEEYLKLVKDSTTVTLGASGKEVFETKGCISCHGNERMAPSLVGLTDDSYLRKSILYPTNKNRGRYQGIMPSYQGTLSEEELISLIQYIKGFRK